MTAKTTFPALAEARGAKTAAERLRRVREAAVVVRDQLLAEGPVLGLRTCPIVTLPYPTEFAFTGAARSPAPFVWFTNRMSVVQFSDVEGKKKTLVFNAPDVERGKKAPFYWKLRERYGGDLGEKVLAKHHGSVQERLAELGLQPDDVDYLAYDHLHIQDVRRWLGSYGEPAFFPRAKLLVMREEWDAARDLHPLQTPWYVPGGTDGVPDDRVVLLDDDVHLGKGVAIVRTPGHTFGNMSLAVVSTDGVWVTSENAVATECFTPELSRIPGVRKSAARQEIEVVINGNTREATLEQYTSMVLEKNLASPSREVPGAVQFAPSSELASHPFAPGLAPTFGLGDPRCGEIRR
jgi:hypothetical protein